MVSTVPIALQIPWRQQAIISPANGTNPVTIALGGFTNGNTAPSKIIGVIVSNNDTIIHDVQLGLVDPPVGYGYVPIGTVSVPINAGYIGSVPSVSLLNSIAALPLDETGQAYLFLNSTDVLQAKVLVAVNTGKEVDIIVFGADF